METAVKLRFSVGAAVKSRFCVGIAVKSRFCVGAAVNVLFCVGAVVNSLFCVGAAVISIFDNVLLLDISKAFDSVKWKILYENMILVLSTSLNLELTISIVNEYFFNFTKS